MLVVVYHIMYILFFSTLLMWTTQILGSYAYLSLRRSNQSILKEISPEYSLEGLMLKLKLQYFGHLIWRTDSLEKTLMMGKIEGGRRRGRTTEDEMVGWMASQTRWTWVWVNSGSWQGQGSLVCFSPWSRKESDTTEWLNWTELTDPQGDYFICYQRYHLLPC